MAELKDTLRADLTTAMKARDKATTTVLRSALAAIGVAEVAGESAAELTADQEQAIVTKEVRKRKESAEAYTEAGRTEQAETELAEAEVLQRYLPKQLDDADLDALVAEEIAAVESQTGEKPTMRQMGQVMKGVNAKVAGRADGSAVAAKVKAALA